MNTFHRSLHLLTFIVITVVGSHRAFAHCDALDGPVVKAAQQALAEGKVQRVLIWVQPRDEAELRQAFHRTLAVRKLNAESRALADQFFFETLVRLHRAGEGAPFTGLKPAGRDPGPTIAAADRAVATGEVAPVLALLAAKVEQGLHRRFQALTATRRFDPNDTAAGRAYVQAYVDFVHYVEAVHESAPRDSHGEAGPAEPAGPHHDAHAAKERRQGS